MSGEDEEPDADDDDLKDWKKDRQQAAGLIFLALEEDQKSHVLDIMDDPKTMWTTLEAVHVQKRSSTRFLAYNTLLSIVKKEDESLTALTARIEKAMQEIKQLRPKDFDIKKLDEDLLAMTMIRALPDEYRPFIQSLSVNVNVDFKTVKDAFRNQQQFTDVSHSSATPSAAANFTKSSQNRQNNKPGGGNGLYCEYCTMNNHEMVKCRRYQEDKAKRQAEVKTRRSNRRNKGNNSGSNNNSTHSTSQSANKASTDTVECGTM